MKKVKQLCDFKKDAFNKHKDEIIRITKHPNFICKKCLRVASHKKYLCEAQKF